MKEAKSAGPWIVAMKDDVRDATSTLQLSISPKLLNELSYDVVWRLASTQIRLGLSVVIDSPLSRRPYLDRLLELAADAGARLVIVECKSNDEDEWRRRLERRGAAEGASWHKPTTWRDLEKLLEEYGGCTQYDVGDVPKLVLDTTAPVGIKEHVSAVLRAESALGILTRPPMRLPESVVPPIIVGYQHTNDPRQASSVLLQPSPTIDRFTDPPTILPVDRLLQRPSLLRLPSLCCTSKCSDLDLRRSNTAPTTLAVDRLLRRPSVFRLSLRVLCFALFEGALYVLL
ncbi:hypothetical protein Acr_00g0064250 [Actinidia rufa]|uniref:P-loop containing nucleoside triphosphate hydrolases superfamily protein n=1 Tax=Actinidia rufa TaxID=165716 RepID=A0A7J0DRB5_9ERIC|nr:hypothetical protein Acr_00g0064250 [Actinidia rufa]